MQKLKFSELGSAQKRVACWLADSAATLTPTILAGAGHVGELWEAEAFLKQFTLGTEQHARLAARLRLGGAATEDILTCIQVTEPLYRTLGQRGRADLADLSPTTQNLIAGV